MDYSGMAVDILTLFAEAAQLGNRRREKALMPLNWTARDVSYQIETNVIIWSRRDQAKPWTPPQAEPHAESLRMRGRPNSNRAGARRYRLQSGEELTAKELAARSPVPGLTWEHIYSRIRCGLTPERAMTQPLKRPFRPEGWRK